MRTQRYISFITFNQIRIHKVYEGIKPFCAVREHITQITEIFLSTLQESSISIFDIKLVSVTQYPGLVGSLIVGINFILGLGKILNIPVIGVNHLYSHIISNIYNCKIKIKNFIGIIISGGHSSSYLYHCKKFYHIGSTQDDSIGECFDKVGRILGLRYPSGKKIDDFASKGCKNRIFIPFPVVYNKQFCFSFSGIKSFSFIFFHYLINNKIPIDQDIIKDFCASFREVLINIIVEKTFIICKKYDIENLLIGGGVSCNNLLKKYCWIIQMRYKINVYIPKFFSCMDNSIMIAYATTHILYNKYNV